MVSLRVILRDENARIRLEKVRCVGWSRLYRNLEHFQAYGYPGLKYENDLASPDIVADSCVLSDARAAVIHLGLSWTPGACFVDVRAIEVSLRFLTSLPVDLMCLMYPEHTVGARS